jgi:hypothetical protein
MFSLALSLLFATSQAHEDTHMLVLDTKVVRGWWQMDWFSLYYRQEWAPDSDTECRVYVKHGDNPTVSRPWVEANMEESKFAFPSSDFVSKYQNTEIYNSCDDALLVDMFTLHSAEGVVSWGVDNEYAWCLSTDASDADGWNSWSQSTDDWKMIPMGICARGFLLKPNKKIYYSLPRAAEI